MLKLDGMDVLRRIKEEPKLDAIPVIVVTTTDDPRDKEMCFSLGCSAYIVKPIDYREFDLAVKRSGLFFDIDHSSKDRSCHQSFTENMIDTDRDRQKGILK